MKKLSKEEYITRCDDIENVLFRSLSLRENLNEDELIDFFTTFIAYLEHSRNNEQIVGRTPQTLEKNINSFVTFTKKIGLNNKEIIYTIKKFPSILHSAKDLEDKYIFLGLIENGDNILRKQKLIERPRDYTIELDVLYARYSLAKSLNYKLTWSSLVKNSEREFSLIFTKSGYIKPYKVFDSIDECTSDKLKAMFPLDINFIEELRNLDVNKYLIDKNIDRRL